MKSLEEIQRAHDILWSQVTGEMPPVFGPDSELPLRAALDVLCWVLDHHHADGFSCTLADIEAGLAERGLLLRRAEQPFSGEPRQDLSQPPIVASGPVVGEMHESASFTLAVDDDSGEPFWRGGGLSDTDETWLDGALTLDPAAFPPGSRVVIVEPWDPDFEQRLHEARALVNVAELAAPAETIAEVLDLDKWDETRGFGSVDGPLCPYCGRRFPKADCGPHGIARCRHCDNRFAWALMPSALGQAWTTWRRMPKQQ